MAAPLDSSTAVLWAGQKALEMAGPWVGQRAPPWAGQTAGPRAALIMQQTPGGAGG